jgi:acetyl esterase/lipase
MIHGGGHVMLSRKDIRPKQTQALLEAGFLPVSVDYRLCPEETLLDGPMYDVCDALNWARTTLPKMALKRHDIRINGDKVVAVGWSTGGHLAMTLAWTSPARGLKPPEAILSFYCPTDYEDEFWTLPNIPRGAENAAAEVGYDIWEGVSDKAITAYNVPAKTLALGGWMAPSDARSRIALHMNWKGQTLPVLVNGLNRALHDKGDRGFPELPKPSLEQIVPISPLAQIRRQKYATPTFLVHGTLDDLIPWQQSQRTCEALVENGVDAESRIIDGAVHLFDIYRGFEDNSEAARAVSDGYSFLRAHVAL